MMTTDVPACNLGELPKRRAISQSCRHDWENHLGGEVTAQTEQYGTVQRATVAVSFTLQLECDQL